MNPEVAAMLEADGLAAAPDDVQPERPELDWIWRAWHRLSLDRPRTASGLGVAVPGRIPWRDVVQWCEVHGYDETRRLLLDVVFGALDVVFLEWWTAQQPKAKP